MALPDTDIEQELLEDEKLDRQIASMYGRPPQESSPESPKRETPPQMKKVMEDIGRTMQEMADGKIEGRYPAVESIINQDPDRYSSPDICTPDCKNRQHAERQANRRLIADVRPPVKERLAIVEHEIDDLNIMAASNQEMLLLAASRDSLKDTEHRLDRRIDSTFTSLKEAIKENVVAPFDKRLEKLEKRRLFRDWGSGITLTISIVYGVITTYLLFTKG